MDDNDLKAIVIVLLIIGLIVVVPSTYNFFTEQLNKITDLERKLLIAETYYEQLKYYITPNNDKDDLCLVWLNDGYMYIHRNSSIDKWGYKTPHGLFTIGGWGNNIKFRYDDNGFIEDVKVWYDFSIKPMMLISNRNLSFN